MYERAYLGRPRKDVKPKPMVEEKPQELDQDEELPFGMSQIKTTGMPGMTEEPDNERVNFVRARMEPESEVTKLGQIKSEQVKSEIVTSCTIAKPNAKETAERKKAKRVKRAMAIVEAGDVWKTAGE